MDVSMTSEKPEKVTRLPAHLSLSQIKRCSTKSVSDLI